MKIENKYFCACETVSVADYPLEEFLRKWKDLKAADARQTI